VRWPAERPTEGRLPSPPPRPIDENCGQTGVSVSRGFQRPSGLHEQWFPVSAPAFDDDRLRRPVHRIEKLLVRLVCLTEQTRSVPLSRTIRPSELRCSLVRSDPGNTGTDDPNRTPQRPLFSTTHSHHHPTTSAVVHSMDRGGTADTVGGMGANRDTDVSNTLRKTRTLEHAPKDTDPRTRPRTTRTPPTRFRERFLDSGTRVDRSVILGLHRVAVTPLPVVVPVLVDLLHRDRCLPRYTIWKVTVLDHH